MQLDIELTSTDLEEAALHVLSGFPAEWASPPVTIEDTIKATVEITGDTSAMLSVAADTGAASALALAFFGIASDELTETDLVDAVKEASNVIGGALKPLLHGMTTLGIPLHNGEQITDTVAVVDYAGGALTLGFRLLGIDGAVPN